MHGRTNVPTRRGRPTPALGGRVALKDIRVMNLEEVMAYFKQTRAEIAVWLPLVPDKHRRYSSPVSKQVMEDNGDDTQKS
jgi:hypothetical protein